MRMRFGLFMSHNVGFVFLIPLAFLFGGLPTNAGMTDLFQHAPDLLNSRDYERQKIWIHFARNIYHLVLFDDKYPAKNHNALSE
jgi:hypothetical protein